eukprot:TRINITY_DN11537_c0_g1_i1.p1 TRINITY_DN11537_c0_g1~~TRINITY_DN11537_c0_g1_i1.p1  ORF type:complete len:768 (+),score=119.98 TRINITY_DN11537_c0_g1_i1:3-2306(+)
MVEPGSWKRMSFDLVAMVALAIDLVMTPLMLAWDMPQEGFVLMFTVMAVSFWTMDCILNLRTGYYHKGELVMNPYSVMCRYAKTTLLPDVLVLVVDWLSVAIAMMGPDVATDNSFMGVKLFRLTKISRLLRISALLRLAHLAEYIERLGDRMSDAGALKYLLDISKIVVIILWVNHVICCMWYGIGVSFMDGADTGQNWLSDPLRAFGDPSYAVMGSFFQYTTAYHWSLTQMTPGSMQVVPRNSAERLFNNIVLIFGMLFFSGLVSSLSATIVSFRMRRSGTAAKMTQLRRFLRQSRISASLSMSIQKQAYDRLTTAKPLLFTDVAAIELLSKSMRYELMFHMCRPHILRNGLFHFLHILDKDKFKHVLEDCINFQFVNPGDYLFHNGDVATHAYYIESGMLRYAQTRSSSNDEGYWDLLDHTDMICEVALWTHWIHVGALKAIQPTVFLSIDVKKHEQCVSNGDCELFHDLAAEFSRLYHQRVVSARPQAWPNDIFVKSANFNEIFASSSTYMRQVMSLALVSSLKNPTIFGGFHFSGVSALDKLEDEINDSKCVLTLNSKGETQRLLAVSVLQLVIGGGAFTLAEIGTWSLEAGLKARCKLPGRKRILDESPAAPVEKVLAQELRCFQRYIDLSLAATSVEEEDMMSETYGIQSTYVRTVYHCNLEDMPGDAVMWLEAQQGQATGFSDKIFAVPRGDKLLLYAFLSLCELERFCNKPQEKDTLEYFLKQYTLDEFVARRAVEWQQQLNCSGEAMEAVMSMRTDET